MPPEDHPLPDPARGSETQPARKQDAPTVTPYRRRSTCSRARRAARPRIAFGTRAGPRGGSMPPEDHPLPGNVRNIGNQSVRSRCPACIPWPGNGGEVRPDLWTYRATSPTSRSGNARRSAPLTLPRATCSVPKWNATALPRLHPLLQHPHPLGIGGGHVSFGIPIERGIRQPARRQNLARPQMRHRHAAQAGLGHPGPSGDQKLTVWRPCTK